MENLIDFDMDDHPVSTTSAAEPCAEPAAESGDKFVATPIAKPDSTLGVTVEADPKPDAAPSVHIPVADAENENHQNTKADSNVDAERPTGSEKDPVADAKLLIADAKLALVESVFSTAAAAASAAAVVAATSAEAIAAALAAANELRESTVGRSRASVSPMNESGFLDEARSLPINSQRVPPRPKIRFDPMMLSYRGAFYFEDEVPKDNFPNLGHCNSKQWVKLNVGGMWFLTTRTTLCRDSDSFFCKLVGGETALDSDTDRTGAFMIDRDPTYFVPVLNYLRHGKVVLNRDMIEEGLLEEAEFYNMTELIKIVNERIAERNAKNTPPPEVKMKTVYRVMQFHDLEVPHLLSTMTDGWKFEQLITIGTLFSCSPSDRGDFLCIVSRECEDTVDSREFSDRVRLLQEKGTL